MSTVTPKIAKQINAVYLLMQNQANHRPMDQMYDSKAEERWRYADAWWKEEDAGEYSAGCCHHDFRPAVILAIEAVRELNTGVDGKETAVKLLKLALKSLVAAPPVKRVDLSDVL